MERLVHFDLFGQEFSFYTDAPEEDVELIINMVRRELAGDEPERRAPLPSNKMLVLGCLKIAAKYVQLSRDYETFRTRQDKSIDRLIDKVSTEMKQNSE